MSTETVAVQNVPSPKIELLGVSKTFATPQGTVPALAETSLQIATNEIVCIVGPSGCGKSTLLNLVAGFIAPSAGAVLVDDAAVAGPGAERAVVFQQDSVFPWLTVEQNLAYGPVARKVPAAEVSQIVERLLSLVGLAEYRDLYPLQLSGGMKKRVDLARAYANKPAILLMDEPFGALDVLTREEMQIELLRLWQEEALTILFVTHDIEEALFIGDRVVVLTPRPARVAADVTVSLDRELDPRRKTSASFQTLRQQLMDILSQKNVEPAA
ncbi:MAG: ABC transporter ATP-binding protein [Anaerolineaceae bacterium]|nr:ABC transporter ATP-binding protein [Anaerolineaceae bacterium]MDE0328457.1 ABC transporter ATP-binding protein [Anaerolineaceae bacterium]